MAENWEIHWKDYYKILQVHPTAEQEVIKGAYDKLARKYHPDVNNSDPSTNARMKDINEAYEILGNINKRRGYHPSYLQHKNRSAGHQEPKSPPRPQPHIKPQSLSFVGVKVGEYKRAKFTVYNTGGMFSDFNVFSKTHLNSYDSWMKIVNPDVFAQKKELPVEIEIEVNGAEWGKLYTDYLTIKLDNVECQLKIQMQTLPEPENSQNSYDSNNQYANSIKPKAKRKKGIFIFSGIVLGCVLVLLMWLLPPFFNHSLNSSLANRISPTSNITVKPSISPNSPSAKTLLFSEDFENGSANGFGNQYGDWKVINGSYTNLDAGKAAYSSLGNEIWKDYLFESDLINGKSIGIFFGQYKVDSNFALIIDLNNNTVGWVTPENKYLVNYVYFHPQTSDKIHIAVEVHGDSFYGYINGTLITVIENSKFPTGPVAIGNSLEIGQYWDNIAVYYCDPNNKPGQVVLAQVYQKIDLTKYYDTIDAIYEDLKQLLPNDSYLAQDDASQLFLDKYRVVSQKTETLINEVININPPASEVERHKIFISALRFSKSSFDTAIQGVETDGVVPQEAYDYMKESGELFEEYYSSPTPTP